MSKPSLWRRWRFHLNALLILIPLGYMTHYFDDAAAMRGDQGLGARDIGQYQVGPWSIKLAEGELGAPEDEGPAGHFKLFYAALCETCADQVKAVYLRVGEPRSLRTAGATFYGSPYRMFAEVKVDPRTTADARLWLTLEGWDGSLHHTTLSLADASPDTLAWLGQQGAKRP